MKNILFIICAFVFTMSVNAVEKPKEKLGGGKVLGVARLIGANSKLIIISCDVSKKTCLYVLKKAVADEAEDICKVMEPWQVPPVAEQHFNSNYPFAFSFDTEVLTFYPATSIRMGCPNETGDVQITIETEATVKLP
ncbi:MAG: hypothetical protein V4590_06270 [Bacteroidota bacterium]